MKESTEDIDILLKRLPVEKTSEAFSRQLMYKISSMPIPSSKRLTRTMIFMIYAGIVGILGITWWITDYFFNWTALYIQPLLRTIVDSFSLLWPKMPHIEYSPVVIGGLLSGGLLLFIDAAIRRRMDNKHHLSKK